MLNIDFDDIQFHSLSIVDRSGRLFIKDQELYRAISIEQSHFYIQLLEQGVIESLVQQGLLVDTSLTNFHLSGYGAVLHHRSIPFISYPYEWVDTMFKDATLLHIDLLIELSKYNLSTDDAGTLNILFDGYKPIFIDFCSIAHCNERALWPGPAYEQFKCTFLNPLEIMAHGQPRIARAVMRDSYYIPTYKLELEYEIFNLGTSLTTSANIKKKTFNFLRKKLPVSVRPIAKSIFLSLKRKTAIKQSSNQSSFFIDLRERVSNIELPNYHIKNDEFFENSFPSLNSSDDWTQKQKHISHALLKCNPRTFMDADSDQGWYAQLAAKNGSKVVALDGSETGVRKLYADSKKNQLYVVPLLIDFTSPKFDLCNDFFVSVNERLGCELVMCLTLTQHLLLKRRLTLEKALTRLFNLSTRWVLLEFIPPDQLREFIPSHNQFAMEKWQSGECLTYEEFTLSLEKIFSTCEILATYERGKKLLLCQK